MSKRIRTTKQATRAREVAVWAINDARPCAMDNIDFAALWDHELGRLNARAILDKRAEITGARTEDSKAQAQAWLDRRDEMKREGN